MSEPTGFNLSAWTLRHKSLVFFLIGMVALFGVLSAGKLSQSEDPPFTFKTMVIQTNWPGATAQQVQEEVTDRIARKLQETPDIDFVQSYSRPGESQIFFNIKDSAPPSEVPETWYQIRKKVGDIQRQLPSGVQGPYFNDEFGDVYVNIYALQGDGYSPAQLHDYADQLRAELLRVPNVAKVDYFGDQNQHVYIDVDNARLAKLGITPQQLGNALNNQNAIASSGVLTTTDDRVFVRPSGQFESLDDLANALLAIGNKRIRLGDVASLHRGYDEPMDTQMRFLGHQVLGIGVSMTPGGNVIDLGKALAQTTDDLQKRLPAGLKLSLVTSMPTAVSHSVDDFLESVAEAVGIVLIVSLLSLGVRTGLVVVISIPFVLAATAWLMEVFGIGLHKVSLGTLVLALGLLVDDAIIAIEMMSVKLEQGWERSRAAAFAYTSTAFPMLTGTLITVSGFLPIAFAKSGTGEYTRSIFEVSAISLLVSWVAAVTLIPLLGYYLLPSAAEQANAAPRWWRRWLPARWRHRTAEPKPSGHEHDIYATPFYRRLQGWLERCMRQRWLVLGITVAMFVLAMIGFGMVPQQFFPSSDRPDLMVDLSLPEGASIDATLRQTKRLEALLASRKDVASYVSFVGSGAPRFYLPLDQKLPQPNFAQFLITAPDIDAREHLAVYLQDTLRTQFPQVRTRVSRLENGPPVGFPVQFRVTGDDIGTVRGIAQQVAAVMRADAHTTNVQYDWDQPAERSMHLHVDQAKARALGVTSQDVANFLAMNLAGTTVTQLRERDKLIDVDLRAAQPDRIHPEQVENLMLPIPNAQPVPLSQLATISYDLEYGVIWERNRQPAIIVEADTIGGAQGVDVTNLIDPKLAQIRAHLPVGYRVEVGGSVEQSGKASGAINQQMPLLLIAVLTLLMIQLQSIGRTIMVVLTAPLGLIGVIIALLLFGKPFGFVAMLGTIAMFGIIMRNSVILVDQIEQDIQAGHSRWDAIIGATTRRFRPITVTAAAAVLALIPLLRSNFFGPMATALMGGITVATVLTLFYLPALYASWFRVRPPQAGREENVR